MSQILSENKRTVTSTQQLAHLSKLSGLTAAERELVAYWRAHGIPEHHASSFVFMRDKHLGRVAA